MRTDPKTERAMEQADWRAYRQDGDPSARERLVERHIPLARYFARRLASGAGVVVEVEELVSAGTLGLMDAVDAFDPARGYRFSTFAARRIRGAMLDELRRRDHASRTVRARERRVARAEDRLSVRLRRAPRHEEVAAELGVEVSTLWGWKGDAARVTGVSLDQPVRGGDGDADRLRDVLGWDGAQEIEDRLTREAELARLRREMAGLGERERMVLDLYDFEEMKLREIAALLQVTESRVSQIRTRAIHRLQASMGDMRRELAA